MTHANQPLPYTDDVETIPADEAKDIERVVQAVKLLRSPDEQSGPTQDFLMIKYQNLAFNVWHALAVHRPLGGINRVRRLAYPVSSAWRRQQAGVTLELPTRTDKAASGKLQQQL